MRDEVWGTEGIKLRVSQVDGSDFADNMWTCSVGEAAKRFTDEQVNDGTALEWMNTVCDLIRARAKAAEEG
jgi:hypothetical protein